MAEAEHITPATPPGTGPFKFEPVATAPATLTSVGYSVDRHLIELAGEVVRLASEEYQVFASDPELLMSHPAQIEFFGRADAICEAVRGAVGTLLDAPDALTPVGVAALAGAVNSFAGLRDFGPCEYEIHVVLKLARSAAAVGATYDASRDAKLFELIRQAREASARADRASLHYDETMRSMPPRPEPPDALFRQSPQDLNLFGAGRPEPTYHEGRVWYGDRRSLDRITEMDGYRGGFDTEGGVSHRGIFVPELKVRRDEILAAHQEWVAAMEDWKNGGGLALAEQEFDAACDECSPLRKAVAAMPAYTFEGLKAKASISVESAYELADYEKDLRDRLEELGKGGIEEVEHSIVIDLARALYAEHRAAPAEVDDIEQGVAA